MLAQVSYFSVNQTVTVLIYFFFSLSQLNTSIFSGSLNTNSVILLSQDETNLEVLYILNQHFQQDLDHNTYLLSQGKQLIKISWCSYPTLSLAFY